MPQRNPNFPEDVPENLRGIIVALALKYAKQRPGLEMDDLVEEGIIKYWEVERSEWYNEQHASRASSSTALYTIIKNHFINLSKSLTVPFGIPVEEVTNILSSIERVEIEFQLDRLGTMIDEPNAKSLLLKLICRDDHKTTIKKLCKEIGISFFKYQQAEKKIRNAITKLSQEY